MKTRYIRDVWEHMLCARVIFTDDYYIHAERRWKNGGTLMDGSIVAESSTFTINATRGRVSSLAMWRKNDVVGGVYSKREGMQRTSIIIDATI